MTGKISEDPAVTTLSGVAYAGVQGGANVKINQSLIDLAYQPLTATLTSWSALSRATGFDTFIVTPSSANLRALLTDETGTGLAYFQGGALGTPASGVATNLTGTAASLTAGAVTTNANLTGPITSVGNATAIASQTGTGTKFVVDNSPSITTPTMTGPVIQTTVMDLQVGQIKFPATQNASAEVNTLDDYEEGSFTPVLAFGGASVGITYAASGQQGRYQKIGNKVTAWIYIHLTSKGSSVGNANISGMPFTALSNLTYYAGSPGYHNITGVQLGIAIPGTTASVSLYKLPGNLVADTDLTNTSEFVFTVFYEAT